MATEGQFPLRDGTRLAAADLSAHQYKFVKLDSSGEIAAISAITDQPYGVLQNTPTAGLPADVVVIGITKLQADSSAVEPGSEIGTSADGQADVKVRGTDSGQFIVGMAIGDPGAAGDLFKALVNCAASPMSEGVPTVEVLEETFAFGDFTDGSGTSGSMQFTGSVPKGAVLLGSKLLVSAGFAGDTSAVLIVGDGSDTDRYHTGTPDVFSTAASGVEMGVPSGNKLLTSANQPTVKVTAASDWGAVSAGVMTISIYYIKTL